MPTIAHSIGTTLPVSAQASIGSSAGQPNRTGLPDTLKRGVEALSGIAMDDVRVHRNSTKPRALGALAFAQGSHIHLGPGQDRHLPHEAWHVVQQKQGRVQPTMQLKGGVAVNDHEGLEREADVMGARATASPWKHALGGIELAGADSRGTLSVPAPIQRMPSLRDMWHGAGRLWSQATTWASDKLWPLHRDRAALANVHHTTQDPLLQNIVGEAIGLNGVDLKSGPDAEKAHAARVNQNDRTRHEVNLDPQQLVDPLTRQSHLLHELIHVSADRRYNANTIGDPDPGLTAVINPVHALRAQQVEIGRQATHRRGLAEDLHNGVDADHAVGDDIKALVKDRANRAIGHPHRELDSVSSELYYEFHRRGVDQNSATFAKVRALAHGTYRSRNEGVPLDQVYQAPQ